MTIYDECIEWDGYLNKMFYGMISLWVNGKTKKKFVHRLVWEEERGPIPPGMSVCHRCDNPPCINIDHLFLGTQADNTRDMYAKGRSRQQKATNCPAGHPLAGDNLHPGLAKKGWRVCRICAADKSKAWHQRKRDEAKAARATT